MQPTPVKGWLLFCFVRLCIPLDSCISACRRNLRSGLVSYEADTGQRFFRRTFKAFFTEAWIAAGNAGVAPVSS